jgi:hypothetical protein
LLSFENSVTNATSRYTDHYITFPEVPPIKEKANAKALAKKINKSINGSGFKIIVDPKEFVGNYKKKMELGLKSTDPEECTFARCCNFAIEEIEEPKLSKDKLVFYVHSTNGKFPVPQRITCENPHRLSQGNITCESLAYGNYA